MTVREALALASLRSATVVAGGQHLDRDVRWTHVVDMPDPLPWVRPGQLLLTTGLSWPKSEAAQRAQVAQLRDMDLAAIALAVPRFLERFPDASRDEANRVGLPLMEIPFEVPFTQITEELHRAIIAEQYEIVERSEHIHRALTRAAASGKNLDDLAHALGELLGRSVTFEDADGKLLAFYDAGGEVDHVRGETLEKAQSPPATFDALEAAGLLAAIRATDEPLRISAMPEIGMTPRVVCPIRLGSELVGLVWIIEGDVSLSELDHRAAEHAALVAALHVAHQRELATTEARLGYASFLSLLEAEDNDPQAIERARLLGFDSEGWHRIAIAVIPEPLPLTREGFLRREAAASHIRNRLHTAGVKPLLTTSLNYVYFLIPDAVDPHAIWRGLGDPSIALLLGRRYRGTKGARTSFLEAKSLLNYRAHGPVRHFEEALVPRVLMGDQGARDAFIEDLFGGLRARKGGHVLELALLSLAKSGFNYKKTAEALKIHLNTLRYRLSRAAEILHADLDTPETRFRLELAARLLDFAHNP
ncbi:MAG TPA: PucR family transcriptional regulator ligand-binding domain-containing protein [Candidatus Eremiobacteraceae bacterium]|nr:PucR family transcriptional regulator ligand-binding domain-containing protein [Candidatus Eremiobacteraceae bacterium]